MHTQLLRGLPAALLTLLMQYGLHMLEHHATTADDRHEDSATAAGARQSRVALVATFLVTVWRENIADGNEEEGSVLVRAVEYTLRGYSRAHLLMGTELLKALLFQLAHGKLEHEERFSPAQMRSLAAVHPAIRFFARGSMESFRVTRWTRVEDASAGGRTGGTGSLSSSTPRRGCRGRHKAALTPWALMRARAVLVRVLNRAHSVPYRRNAHDADEDEEEQQQVTASSSASPVTLPLGHHIILHLARLHAQIHRLQADLEGTMEFVMLTSAKDYNVLNDEVFALTELMGSVPPASRLVPVAMLTLSLCLVHRFPSAAQGAKEDVRAAWDWYESSRSGQATHVGALPLNYLRLLSTLRVGHLEYSEEPHEAAQAELQRCRVRAVEEGAVATVRWLDAQQRAMASAQAEAERAYRTDHVHVRARLRRCTYRTLGLLGCGKEGENGAESHSNEEEREEQYSHTCNQRVKEVAAQAEEDGSSCHATGKECGGGYGEDDDDASNHDELAADRRLALATSYLLPRALLSHEDALFVCAFVHWLLRSTGGGAALDVALYLVTAAATFFVGLTDGECYRLGYVLHSVVQAVQKSHAVSESTRTDASSTHDRVMEGTTKRNASIDSNKDSSATTMTMTRPTAEDVCAAEMVHTTDDEAAAESCRVHVGRHTQEEDNDVNEHLLRCPPRRLLTQTRGGRRAMTAAAESAAAAVAHTPRLAPAESAAPLQLEAYLCRWVRQVLVGGGETAAHMHRNMLVVLRLLLGGDDASEAARHNTQPPTRAMSTTHLHDSERTKVHGAHTVAPGASSQPSQALPDYRGGFPLTRVGCAAVLRAVAPHADDKLPSYAAASSVLKRLRQRARAMTVAHDTLTRLVQPHRRPRARHDNSDGDSSDGDTEEEGGRDTTVHGAAAQDGEMHVSAVRAWLQRDRWREHYVQYLLRNEAAEVSWSAEGEDDDDDDTRRAATRQSAMTEAKDDMDVLAPIPDEDEEENEEVLVTMDKEEEEACCMTMSENKSADVKSEEVCVESMQAGQAVTAMQEGEEMADGLPDTSPALSPTRSLSPLSSSSSSLDSLCSCDDTTRAATMQSGHTTQSMEALALDETCCATAVLVGGEEGGSACSMQAGLADVHMDEVGVDVHTLSPISDDDEEEEEI